MPHTSASDAENAQGSSRRAEQRSAFRHGATPKSLTSLAMRSNNRIGVTPITRIDTPRDTAMKRRVRPIAYRFDQSVFERIDMDVAHMRRVIAFIADRMFPEPTRPEAAPWPRQS
ncbi:MAG: hypothetical protein ACK5NS_05205 [Denitromonas sp.]